MTGRMGRNVGPITEELMVIFGTAIPGLSEIKAHQLMDCIVRLIDAKLAVEGERYAFHPNGRDVVDRITGYDNLDEIKRALTASL